MEPARSTGNFNRKITVADSNNIIAILDMNATNSKYQIFEQDYLVEFQGVLEDLKVTVGLLSLAEAPWPDTNALMSESEQMAEIARVRTEGQKISLGLYTAIGNGPWQYESEVVLQNQGGSETHVPILVPFLSSNETLLMAGNFKLGVKVEAKWNQPLKNNDYLVIKGTWRQVVSFSKKKDDDVEFLAARIEALELALYGKLTNLPANSLLGRGSTSGVAEAIANDFMVKAANETVIGKKIFSETLESLKELVSKGNGILSNYATETAARLFAINGGGAYLNLTCTAAPSGSRNVDLELSNTGNISFRRINDAYNAIVANIFQANSVGDFRLFGFTTLGDNVALKIKQLTGTTPSSQGSTVTLIHGLNGSKIIGYLPCVYHDGIGGSVPSDFDSFGPGYAYDCWHSATEFFIQNSAGNSAYILNKAFSILVIYTT